MCQIKAGVAVGKRNCLLGLQSTDSHPQYLLGSSGVTNVDNLLVCASCIKWLGIKKSLGAPSSAAGEAKYKSSIFITQDFLLRSAIEYPPKRPDMDFWPSQAPLSSRHHLEYVIYNVKLKLATHSFIQAERLRRVRHCSRHGNYKHASRKSQLCEKPGLRWACRGTHRENRRL